jgi:hypothetical protein
MRELYQQLRHLPKAYARLSVCGQAVIGRLIICGLAARALAHLYAFTSGVM